MRHFAELMKPPSTFGYVSINKRRSCDKERTDYLGGMKQSRYLNEKLLLTLFQNYHHKKAFLAKEKLNTIDG